MPHQAILDRYEAIAILLEKMNCAVVVRDAMGIVTAVSPRLLRWLGFERDQIEGRPLIDFVPSDARDANLEAMEMTKSGDNRARLTVIQRKDRTTVPVLVLATPFHDANGEYVGTCSILIELATVQTAKSLSEPEALQSTLQRIAIELRSICETQGVGTAPRFARASGSRGYFESGARGARDVGGGRPSRVDREEAPHQPAYGAEPPEVDVQEARRAVASRADRLRTKPRPDLTQRDARLARRGARQIARLAGSGLRVVAALLLIACSPGEEDASAPAVAEEDTSTRSGERVTSKAAQRASLPYAPEIATFDRPETFLTLPDVIDEPYRDEVRSRTRTLLSPRARSDDHPPVARATGRATREGIELSWFELEMSDGQRLRAALLHLVGQSPRSLVVALHGHDGPNARGIELLLDPSSYQHGVGVVLARAGHAVLAVETRGFGRSPTGPLSHVVYTNRLRLQGREFLGQVVSDNRAALDFALTALPSIERVGAIGCSLGGLSALILSTLDDRIDDILISGVMGSFAGSFASAEHCPCSILPGVLLDLDLPQWLAASHASRIGIESGRADGLLGIAHFEFARDEVEAVRARSDRTIVLHEFDGGHEHDTRFALDFFRPSL